MDTFIRVAELWLPNKDRSRLEFGGGLYGNLTNFRAASEGMQFAFDEGLPGKAWAAGRPIILKEFENSYFKRTDAAKASGLTCGVALPVFAGEFLMAVAVFFCGDDEASVGAIELWTNGPEEAHFMSLADGYYGAAEMFEFNSRVTKFPRGYGLPGRVWKKEMPMLVKDLFNSRSFLRWEQAVQIGVNRGLGIPYGLASGPDMGRDVPVGAQHADRAAFRNLGPERRTRWSRVRCRRLRYASKPRRRVRRHDDCQRGGRAWGTLAFRDSSAQRSHCERILGQRPVCQSRRNDVNRRAAIHQRRKPKSRRGLVSLICPGLAEAARFANACRADSFAAELATARTGEDGWPSKWPRSAAVSARAGAPAVVLDNVSITFRLTDGGSYTAVKDASLSVADGEFVAIVGPTGCGKSTLLNVAAGLIAPSSGRADIFGSPLAGLNRAGRLPVSGRCPVPVEDRAGERRHRP